MVSNLFRDVSVDVRRSQEFTTSDLSLSSARIGITICLLNSTHLSLLYPLYLRSFPTLSILSSLFWLQISLQIAKEKKPTRRCSRKLKRRLSKFSTLSKNSGSKFSIRLRRNSSSWSARRLSRRRSRNREKEELGECKSKQNQAKPF